MIKYIDVKTGEVLGEYPPSKDKPIYVVVDREAYEYLEQVKRKEQSDDILDKMEMRKVQNHNKI